MARQLQLLEPHPTTEENLPRGHARCVCRDCWDLVIGRPGEVLCSDCKRAGCDMEGGACKRPDPSP